MPDDDLLDDQTSVSGPIEESEMTAEEIAQIEIGPEAVSLPPLTTAADLLAAQEEIPPEPPLAASPGGPQPPEGLRFDFAWERTVIPASPADRQRERISDESGYVPLPLAPGAAAEWAKSIALWIGQVQREMTPEGRERIRHNGGRPGLQDYGYLLRKGHIGALEHLYPADEREERYRNADEFATLLVRHGFTDRQAVKTAKKRRTAATEAIIVGSNTVAQKRLAESEAQHVKRKDEFSKAFVAAQKRKSK